MRQISVDDARRRERIMPLDSEFEAGEISEGEEPTHVKSNGREQQHVPSLPTNTTWTRGGARPTDYMSKRVDTQHSRLCILKLELLMGRET